ncbi:putative dehydrogenase [Kribbella amoyensis]|uniref:Putative dehydrogenase n=1 Tax=Kribbella amoyensis TaxID=996641 RepID=A0A561BKB0_9ACTN|nr:Gfo/Idh/MocA family oxidoreductase [Kribbella amoyensis]TWD79316.1 putative dehydrogenase [Kribbella amoyensis]
MRFGLVGTGPWAHRTHGPGLLAAADAELVGVWGRDPDKAGKLATELGVSAFTDYAALLESVDAVAFAVPPRVQATMALEAAAIGKHLLLDKPVADNLDDARALADEVADEGLASVVFFTARFAPEYRAFFSEVAEAGGWKGGWARMIASLDAPGNPYVNSAWRREKRGALWDVGPHALSNLSAMLGPVVELRAVGGEGDLVHLVITHESGATSTASLSLSAPPDGTTFETGIWGETGTRLFPRGETPPEESFRVAVQELVAAAESGDTHPVDVGFGLRVAELLASAEAQLNE